MIKTNQDLVIRIIWFPRHTNIRGNDLADKYAEQAASKNYIHNKLVFHCNEIVFQKRIIVNKFKSDLWNNRYEKGRRYFPHHDRDSLLNKLPPSTLFFPVQ